MSDLREAATRLRDIAARLLEESESKEYTTLHRRVLRPLLQAYLAGPATQDRIARVEKRISELRLGASKNVKGVYPQGYTFEDGVLASCGAIESALEDKKG